MTADPGLVPAAVTAWLDARVGAAPDSLSFERIAGGRSNLTYRVHDEAGGRSWVLRRAPLGMGDSRAHDVLREAGVLGRLAGTDVPVPAVIGECDDPSLIGAPFYVMEFVDGVILRDPAAVRSNVAVELRPAYARSLVTTLARLHTVDPRSVGWGALAERTDYLSRQISRWSANWEADRVRVLPDIARARDRLRERVPVQSGAAIVHGDFRIDNCVFAETGQVRALLDWELTTVGDPLADVGQLLTYWGEPADAVRALEDPPTLAGGFPGRDELVRLYVSETGRESEPDLRFHLAFNWWKVACIVEGVYTRTARGAMGESDRTPESFAAQAERLAAEAWRYAREL